MTIHRLALLAQMDRGALERRLHGVDPFQRDGNTRLYRLADVLPRLCHETQDAATARRMAEHRERQAKADADTAEMNAGKQAGVLMLAIDARKLWEDGFVKIRRVIESARGLTGKQRRELSEGIQKITLGVSAPTES